MIGFTPARFSRFLEILQMATLSRSRMAAIDCSAAPSSTPSLKSSLDASQRRRQDLDSDFFSRRVEQAIAWRVQTGCDPELCRLVWSEGDGLPWSHR